MDSAWSKNSKLVVTSQNSIANEPIRECLYATWPVIRASSVISSISMETPELLDVVRYHSPAKTLSIRHQLFQLFCWIQGSILQVLLHQTLDFTTFRFEPGSHYLWREVTLGGLEHMKMSVAIHAMRSYGRKWYHVSALKIRQLINTVLPSIIKIAERVVKIDCHHTWIMSP